MSDIRSNSYIEYLLKYVWFDLDHDLAIFFKEQYLLPLCTHRYNIRLLNLDFGRFMENTQKHWNMLSEQDREFDSQVILQTRSGLKKTNNKYNYESGRCMSICPISYKIVYTDEIYYVDGFCMWPEPYGAEINVEAEDKYRSIGSNFGFSDDTLYEVYMDLLRDDDTYVNGMKSCRKYLREASDYEESQIKLHFNE